MIGNAQLTAPTQTKAPTKPWWVDHAFRRTANKAEVTGRPLQGASVAIVGGGPGLDPKLGKWLCAGRCVAVNNAYLLATRPVIVVALDRRWWLWHGEAIRTLGHIGVTTLRQRQGEHQNFTGFAFNKDHLTPYASQPHTLAGLNSGHAAINLAMHLGAKDIYLAGFDMGFEDKSHWHTPHNVPARNDNYARRFRPPLEELANNIAPNHGVTISAITHTYADIPKTPLDIAMESLRNA